MEARGKTRSETIINMAELKAAILLFVFSLLVFQQGRVNCALWSQGFRVFRTEAELEEFKQLNPRERLDTALKFPASEILEITGANQAATVQEGVSLNIDCLPWLQLFPEGSSIQWYSTLLDEIGNPIGMYAALILSIANQTNVGFLIL